MARQNRSVVYLLGLMLLIAGCEKSTVSVNEYIEYMHDKEMGLIQTKEMDGLVIKVRYLTPELMALNELKSISVSREVFDSTLNGYQGLKYYSMSMMPSNGGHVYGFLKDEGISAEDIEAHLNFDGQADYKLISGKDTAKCVLYTFAKTYGLAKQFDVVLGFDVKSSPGGEDIMLEMDASFLGRGLLKFRYERDDINGIPSIVI
jgi:hypothetical protein